MEDKIITSDVALSFNRVPGSGQPARPFALSPHVSIFRAMTRLLSNR